MWTSFLKAFFVYIIVLGIQEIGLGTYYAFKRQRIEKLRWLSRGISWIAIAVLGLWLLKHGWLNSWDEPASFVMALLPAVIMSVSEIYIKVRVEHQPFSSVFSQPRAKPRTQPQSPRNVEPLTRRFALLSSFIAGLFALEAAVVFSIVSPELLGIRWWVVIVALVTLVGLAFGMYLIKLNRFRVPT